MGNETTIYKVHTLKSNPDMKVGYYLMPDESAKIVIELHVSNAPKTVGEVLKQFREKLCK